MKNNSFVRPKIEVVRFNNNVIRTSSCGCYDDIMGIVFEGNCSGQDTPAHCTCQINHVAGTANCTPAP